VWWCGVCTRCGRLFVGICFVLVSGFCWWVYGLVWVDVVIIVSVLLLLDCGLLLLGCGCCVDITWLWG